MKKLNMILLHLQVKSDPGIPNLFIADFWMNEYTNQSFNQAISIKFIVNV